MFLGCGAVGDASKVVIPAGWADAGECSANPDFMLGAETPGRCAEEETERERRREAGETVSDDEDQVCPGCEAEKRGEKGVPHLSDHFNVPPTKKPIQDM